MRTLPAVSISLLITAAVAGEAEPWLTVSVPDGARTAEHFNASIYGKVLNSPEFAPLKAKWAASIAVETGKSQQGKVDAGDEFALQLKEAGVNPLDLFTSLRFLEVTLQGEVEGKPKTQLQPGLRVALDLGDRCAQIVAKVLAREVEKGALKPIVAAGADAAFLDADAKHDVAGRILRFGTQFVLTNSERAEWQKAVRPASTPVPAAHDLVVHWMPALCAAFIDKSVPAAERAAVESVMARLRRMAGAVDLSADLVPAGMSSRLVIPEAPSYYLPVDQAVLAKLPANTLSAIAAGIDGAAWWAKEKGDLFKALGSVQTPPISGEQLEQNLDLVLKGQGLTTTTATLVSGIKGTGLFALMQAAPFPTALLAIPRSQGVDELVKLVLKQAQQPELPAEGGMAMIPLGALPVSLTLVRAPNHWLLTTDTMLASTWTGTAPGGWLESPVGKLAVEKAGSDAWLVGAADNAAEIRMYTGFLAMGIQQIPNLTPEERTAVMKTMQVLAREAKPGWCTGRTRGTATEVEVTGLGGGLTLPAIIAAIAIPNLLESRVTANEAAASATLKAGVFAAEVQFQAGAYIDQDKNGVGEYGFFQEMAGGPLAGQAAEMKLQLLTPAFNAPEPESNGYRFAIYLPDGQGGATAERLGVRQADAKAAAAQEKSFVVYAWPIDDRRGRHVFALTQEGQVRCAPGVADGQAPAWNALFGGEGKGWGQAPVWPVYHR